CYAVNLVASSLATFTPATVSAAAAAATAITSAATARRSLLSRTRLVYSHRPSVHSVAVKFRNSVLRFLLRTHGHKCEPTRFASESVLHESHFLHSSSLREKFLQFVLRGIEGEIAYV